MSEPDNNVRGIQIDQMTEHLSERMTRLCREVLYRLPAGWDEYRTIGFVESDDRPTPSPDTIGFACVRRDEESESFPHELPAGVQPEQCWTVILYLNHLQDFSDKAVLFVIAHELGHVASGLRTGSLVIGGVPMTPQTQSRYKPAPPKERHEDQADIQAISGGFTEELQQFLAETQW